MHKYTPEDLLLYLYKEMSEETTAAIEKALAEDWTLREKLAVLKSSMERLNQITESPRTEVVLNVLKHLYSTEKISKDQQWKIEKGKMKSSSIRHFISLFQADSLSR